MKTYPYSLAATCVAIMTLTTARADYPGVLLSHNPAGYWRLNETAPVPIADEAVNIGSFGTQVNGYYRGSAGATYVHPTTPGVLSGSTDGATTLNAGTPAGYMSVPYSASLNPGAFTAEAWINPSAVDGTVGAPAHCVLSSMDAAAPRAGWLVYVGGDGWNLRMYNQNGSTFSLSISGGGTVSGGTWYHVAVTFDGTTATLYVDGVPVVSGTPTGTPSAFVPATYGNLTIGARSDGAFEAPSMVEELAFYTNVLSATTIAAHFSAATTNGTGYAAQILAAGPVGYWRLGDPAYTPPTSLPTAANSGYLAASAQGTYQPGMSTGAAGPGYSGLGGATVGGFNGIAGYVDCGTAVPDLSAPLSHMTIMVWAKFSTHRSMDWESIITCGDTAWDLQRNNNDTSIGFRFAGNDLWTSGARPINDGKWHHIAATYDGAQQKIYLDGTLEIAGNKTGSNAGETIYPILIGENGRYPGRVFNGNIAEMAVFTNALSASDVWAVYTASWLAPTVLTPAYATPADTTYEGSTVTLNVTAGGAAPLAYQWSKGTSKITGATGSSYVLTTNAVVGDSGTYSVVITNTYGAVTSSVVLAVVHSPPLIFTQPASIRRFVDSPATFTVVDGGSLPRYYQWQHGTTPVPGGTAATLTLPNVQWGDAGTYTCTITNAYGTTNTAPATLTVEGQFVGTVLPDALARDRHTALGSDGTNLYFTHGTGSGSAFYRIPEGTLTGWTTLAAMPTPTTWDNDSGVGDMAYFGGAMWTLARAAASPGARGVYRYDIATDTWTVSPFTTSDGPNTAIAVAATTNIFGGWAGLGYSVPMQEITDYTTGTIAPFGDAGGAFSHAWDACDGPTNVYFMKHDWYLAANPGELISVNKTGTPTITKIGGMPFNPGMGCAMEYMPGTLLANGHASLFLLRVGTGTGDQNDAQNWTTPATTDQLAVYDLAAQTWDLQPLPFAVDIGSEMALVNQTLYVLAGNGDPRPLKMLYLGPPVKPTVVDQPISQTVFQGQSATFRVGPFGGGPFTFQWRHNGNNINGGTGNILTVANAYYTDAGSYDVVVTNPAGSTNSQTATLTVLYPPLFANLTNDLVLHLKFDGDYLDSSAKGHNATAVGSPTFVPGRLGQAFHYNTDNSNPANIIYNYATLGSPADLMFGASQDFSVSYWIRFTGPAVDLPVFSNDDCGEGCIGFFFGPSVVNGNGGWAWSFADSSYTGPLAEGPPNSINDGQWHHVLSTFVRTNLAVTYLDGVQVDSRSISSFTASLDNLNPVNVGQVGTGTYGVVFGADVDDLGVWLRALSPTEAESIYMVAQQGKSFDTFGPVVLTIHRAGADVELIWQTGQLQSSTTGVTGTYNAVGGASAPYYRVTPGSTPTFYRVKL